MNKFKFSFKIEKLELSVEGTREDIGTITNSIGQQFQGLLQPAGSIGEANSKSSLNVTEEGEITEIKNGPKKRSLKSGRSSAGSPRTSKAAALDFKNDSSKYGSPLQSWTGLQKSIWLLYVLNNEMNISELSAGEIAITFNKHFKQQGTVRPSNIARDLGSHKSGAAPEVGENTTVSPTKWYLTDAGVKMAQSQIADMKNSAK